VVNCGIRLPGIGDAGDLAHDIPGFINDRRAARTRGEFGGHVQEQNWAAQH